MKKHILALAMAGLAFIAHPSLAGTYPEKQVRVVVGYPPGGASDIVARMLAQELEALNGQSFIIDNKPGVGGMLSLSDVAKSRPDGYTLGLGVSGTLVTGPHLQKNKLYDPRTDFSPIGMVAKVPMVLLAGPSLKHDTVAGMIAEAKQEPGHMIFASGAQAFELALHLLNHKAGVKIESANYKGGAAASIDVIGGRVPIMVDSIGAQQVNVKEGRLRALAVLDSSRSAALPDVPTMQEAGIEGYEAVGWIALMAPKGTPDNVVEKLNRQINEIVQKPSVQEKLISLGFEPAGGTTSGLQETIETEYEKWGDVVRAAGMTNE